MKRDFLVTVPKFNYSGHLYNFKFCRVTLYGPANWDTIHEALIKQWGEETKEIIAWSLIEE